MIHDIITGFGIGLGIWIFNFIPDFLMAAFGSGKPRVEEMRRVLKRDGE
jgi:hypothetical protein